MGEEVKLLEKEIIESLPQIPYIIDQIGYALEWAKETHDEGAYLQTVKFVLDVCKFVQKTSEPHLFKVHLVIAAILMDIPEAISSPKFEMFKSASNSVENSLKALLVDEELNKRLGLFRAVSVTVNRLAANNQDCLTIMLYNILSDLKEIIMGMKGTNTKVPITGEDYIKVLGYAYVVQNLRLASMDLLNASREVLNEIDILLNNDLNF